MSNDYLKTLAKADELAKLYFEGNPNSVRFRDKKGFDAVCECYFVARYDSDDAPETILHFADFMAKHYFEKGSDSVTYGDETGIDAVRECYLEVIDVVQQDTSEAMDLYLHASDFFLKVALDGIKSMPKTSKAALQTKEAQSGLKNLIEAATMFVDVGIENSTGANKTLLMKKRTEYVAIINTEYQKLTTQSGGCYIATAVYGSYDCPQVWTLRRYRDNSLANNLSGRVLIHIYYAISPILVKRFGKNEWIIRLWRGALDKLVKKLQKKGYEDKPYTDISL